MSTYGWGYYWNFNKANKAQKILHEYVCLSEEDIRAEARRLLDQDINPLKKLYKERLMQKEEKIEAGDWVRVVRHYLDQDLIVGSIHRVSICAGNILALENRRVWFNQNKFEIVRKHDAPFRIGDKVASCFTNCETLILSDSHEAMEPACKPYYTLVEPVESIEYKKEKEKMCISPKSKNEEYKLRYKQVKDFSVKDLEEAGAYESAVLKILRDKKIYYDTPLLDKKWTEEREQYFDQDFNGVNGLVWLEKHGFIQKIEPGFIYAKDLKYGEYAVITEGLFKGVIVCVPYGTNIIMNISDAHDTWESDFPCRLNKISRPTIIVDPQN